MKYQPVIGVETHVQLNTKSKLFCGCDNDSRDAKPNTHVCPVCLGLPGTLPYLNKAAVELAIRAGLALNCKIAENTQFERKNYFYPDIPKGYQITQYQNPIAYDGKIEIPIGGKTIEVGITRSHMEEDTGKLVHPAGKDYSLVDLNRAGTPLVEIVSEPDLRSANEAKAYAQELVHTVRYAGVSEADLYHGHVRFDVNVSLMPEGSKQFGTRTEIKNLNSFRSVERATEYEIKRQGEELDKGEKITQETRGWDEAKSKTFSQRSKEEAHDYRYFPEPDLPPLVIKKAMIDAAQQTLPTLPAELRSKLASEGLNNKEIEALVNYPVFVGLLTATKGHTKRIGGWLAGEVISLTSDPDYDWAKFKLSAKGLDELDDLVDAGKLSSTAAKTVLAKMLTEEQSPQKLANEMNLIQESNEDELGELIKKVMAENPQSVADFKAGKQAAMGFLVGQIMKASGGRANPQIASAILKKQLDGTQ